ncbi:MAG: ureidoglycolate lyase [Archangiaceae bacterium]|nr:ureidoglycolate lyase [Archangiaceae bacterium]
MRTLRTEALTAAAFAPFGQVLQSPFQGDPNMNQGTAMRLDRAAALTNSRGTTCAPNLAMVRSLPQSLPLKLRLLERHPCSSQAFIPLRCARYLVVVAPSTLDGQPDWGGLRAFVAGPGLGINYAVGTWHHPFVALDQPAELALLVWEDGTARDCEEVQLPSEVTVEEA